MSQLVVGLALVACVGVEGARVARKSKGESETKFIAGVPVLNYHLAYPDQAGLAELGGSFAGDIEQDWIIGVTPATTDDEIHSLCQLGDCKAEGHPSEGGVPFFEIRATEKDLESLLLSARGVAEYVEPDSMKYAIPSRDEPEATPWGLNRIGTSRRSSTGKNTHIYVHDTGIRSTHREFGGRVIPTLDMTKSNFVCRSSDKSCAADRDGHGTHCSGTAAGASYGVAPQATVHAVKTLDDQGGGPWSWDYKGLDWIATKGQRPAVVSMSLGGPGQQSGMKTAVNAAVAAGVTVVVAAGNENDNACRYTPAYVPAVIAVGATTSRDQRSGFSNFGSCTNIWAPGSAILSSTARSDSSTATWDGTSMACPHVSGGVALLLQKDPRMKPTKVLSTLLNAAESGKISGLKSGDTNKLLHVAGF